MRPEVRVVVADADLSASPRHDERLGCLAVGGGSAIAAIPNNGTYYACLTKSTGAIKVINYPKVKCAKGQKLIKWSQRGPAGPQGAQGPQGPAGPADWNAIPNIPAGFNDGVDDAGVTAVRIRTVTSDTPTDTTDLFSEDTVDRPAGFLVVGGGYDILAIPGVTDTPWMIVFENRAVDADT